MKPSLTCGLICSEDALPRSYDTLCDVLELLLLLSCECGVLVRHVCGSKQPAIEEWQRHFCQLSFHPSYMYFYHDNSRRVWHGNVHDNVNVFGLGGIVLLRCCRVSTETCYGQYIHNMLLCACMKYCYCTCNI